MLKRQGKQATLNMKYTLDDMVSSTFICFKRFFYDKF